VGLYHEVEIMASPTVGITILIVLAFTILGQFLFQRFEQKKRHKELKEQLNRLEARPHE
jgi:preprotein translocase subunit YajC